MVVLKFIRVFIDENPLCCCSEEITKVKREVSTKNDEIKLRQKNSSLTLISTEKKYRHKMRIIVPEDYPDTRVRYACFCSRITGTV